MSLLLTLAEFLGALWYPISLGHPHPHANISIHIFYWYNPGGYHNINELDLATKHLQISLTAPLIHPLAALYLICNNFLTFYWIFHDSISHQTPTVDLLRDTSILLFSQHLT